MTSLVPAASVWLGLLKAVRVCWRAYLLGLISLTVWGLIHYPSYSHSVRLAFRNGDDTLLRSLEIWSLILGPIYLVLQGFSLALLGKVTEQRASLLIDAALVFCWSLGYCSLVLYAMLHFKPVWL